MSPYRRKEPDKMVEPHFCLKCDSVYDNTREIAVCDTCLEGFRKARKRGVPSGYISVDMYLRKEEGKQ